MNGKPVRFRAKDEAERLAAFDHQVALAHSDIAELELRKAALKRDIWDLEAKNQPAFHWERDPPPKRTHAILMMARGCEDWIYGTIRSWFLSARDPEQVIVALRVDRDDTKTIDAITRSGAKFPSLMFIGDRPRSPGIELTHMAATIRADFYHIMNDDNFALEFGWDRHVSAFAEDFPGFGMAGWCPAPPRWRNGLPGYAGDYPVFQREWFEAAGEIFTHRFPFWFMDLSACHVYELVRGHKPYPLRNADDHTPVELAARKSGPTQRFRDYEFWVEYFFALMPERVAQAERIAARLNLQPFTAPGKIAELNWRSRQILLEDEQMQATVRFAAQEKDRPPPDPAYLAAKAAAEAHLAELTVIAHGSAA